MLKPTLALVILFSIFRFAAIAQDTTWFDVSWKVTASENHYFFRTKIRTDSGWMLTDHYKSGKPQMVGFFLDDSLKVRQGMFHWYLQDGTIARSATYSQGKLDGIEQLYYLDGAIKLKGVNKEGKKEGEWKGFFPSGKLAGKAVYHADKQTVLTLYKEDGSRNVKDTTLWHDSGYPGGPSRFLYFLNRNLRYPDSAVVHEIEGTVLVAIYISKEGKITNLKIERSANPYLDAEALRVMRLMQDWEPAAVAGVRVESVQLQPVIFSLGKS